MDLVGKDLKGQYVAIKEKKLKVTYVKESKPSRHLYKGSYDGPTLKHLTIFTLVRFQTEWEKYVEQEGVHDLKGAIVGFAAVDR